jgi:hypothetical protein
MTIYQPDLAASSGIIQTLATDGGIKIQNGPTIRINDPNAKYSTGYTGLPFFTADDEYASISAFSGFPMCVLEVPLIHFAHPRIGPTEIACEYTQFFITIANHQSIVPDALNESRGLCRILWCQGWKWGHCLLRNRR